MPQTAGSPSTGNARSKRCCCSTSAALRNFAQQGGTILSVADRLATRGARSEEAIDAHLRLAAGMLEDALAWHEQPQPAPQQTDDAPA